MQPNTLRYHLNRPVFRKRDLRDTPIASVAGQLNARMEVLGSDTKPEVEALRFYLCNHFMADMQMQYHLDEPLPQEVNNQVKVVISTLNDISLRLFYYLLAICTRESRHNRADTEFFNELKSKYGEDAYSFYKGLQWTKSSEAVGEIRNAKGDFTLGCYTNMLVHGFYEGTYSHGYGGKAWGQVADCLNAFVQGEVSGETMVDIGWTLCHNNGPIFNKGMLYGMYKSPHTKYLTKLLDVQRAGLIPALFREMEIHGVHHTGFETSADSLFKVLNHSGWDSLPEYIDWFEVTALGAVGNYSKEKEAQIKYYGGESEAAKKEEEAMKAKAAAKEAEEAKFKADWFEVSPSVAVSKIKRAA